MLNLQKVQLYKLGLNNSKGGWNNLSLREILNLMRLEVGELEMEFAKINLSGNSEELLFNIALETADIANFCMMMVDKVSKEINLDELIGEAEKWNYSK